MVTYPCSYRKETRAGEGCIRRGDSLGPQVRLLQVKGRGSYEQRKAQSQKGDLYEKEEA